MPKWQDDLQFYSMHFMPYASIPPEHENVESYSVDYSNANLDNDKVQAFYKRYISELVLADKLGYDGLVVNEHHATAYSLMPACNIIAATLIPQTSRAKICIFGTPINLVPPQRLAEEYAMLDHLSGGRLEIAVPLGIGMEYWSNQVNPATARERFREGMDVLTQAWTQPGPTTFDGEFYSYRYLNPYPRPLQKPHPKIFMLGTGSPETVDYAARNAWGYASVFVPRANQIKAFRQLRELYDKYGHVWTPDKAAANTIVYVAETDEIARREAEEHIFYYFHKLLKTTNEYFVPPGYLSPASLRGRLASVQGQEAKLDWETMSDQIRIAVGSPQTVADLLAQWSEEIDSSRLILHLHLGDMPHWKVVKNLTLFAEEVMPRLRGKAPVAA
jgi:alkanesulfonate monooxygenase SsuD/methylene tetrahydromethanopterin reductase-like flavin-dependent oxidoreductase (luciferase family)